MADSEVGQFTESDKFYRRVRADCITSDGKILAAAAQVKDFQKGLSCDWASKTDLKIAAKGSSFLMEFLAKDCWDIGLVIEFSPIIDPTDPLYNLAHCHVFCPAIWTRPEIVKVRDEFLLRAKIISVQ